MTTQPDSFAIRDRLPYLSLSGGVVVVDRLTKNLIDEGFGLGETLTLIAGFFNLTYVQNTGVAFGLFASTSSPSCSISEIRSAAPRSVRFGAAQPPTSPSQPHATRTATLSGRDASSARFTDVSSTTRRSAPAFAGIRLHQLP